MDDADERLRRQRRREDSQQKLVGALAALLIFGVFVWFVVAALFGT